MEGYEVIKTALEDVGFAEIEDVQSIQAAEQLTSQLGPLRSLNGNNIQILKPSSKELARSPSFSRHYGYGRFPLHTDTSFWKVPARYVVTYMSKASSTDTMVLSPPAVRELLLRFRHLSPIFIRSTVSGVNYANPWFGAKSEFVVFDPCYMKPVNQAAVLFSKALDEYFDSSQKIAWHGSKMLIVDNWRTLHGRQPARDDKRFLCRFYRGGK